ncbi:hypothetical protein [Nonomuraea rosea]
MVVIVPLLDESDVFDDSLHYFKEFVARAQAELYFVTSDREFTINQPGSARDTVRLAARAAAQGYVVHIHLSDAAAHKSDQVNFAASVAARQQRPADDCLVVVYDVDSRPEAGSLHAFRSAAAKYRWVNVFHQSARFEMRMTPQTFDERIADAGALRANRFVLSMELPRLLARRPDAGRLRSLLARWTYGKVTGHGLCVRLPFLLQVPLPARRPVEDMHWSFVLAARGEPVVPISCFDRSDVPDRTIQQFFQMERWFLGPARAVTYARDPLVPPGPPRVVLILGALAESAEWLSAVFAVPVVVYSAVGKSGPLRTLFRVLSVIVLAELVTAEAILGEGHLARRLQRIALYPFAVTGFGAAGWLSLINRAIARPQHHKTEHTFEAGG